MPCRLDRLWHPTWLGFRSVPVRFHTGSRLRCAPSQNGPSFSRNGCQNGFPKRPKVVQNLSKEVSQNDVRTRPSERTDPDPPINLENRAPVRAPALFSLSTHARKNAQKVEKAAPRDPKVDKKLKQNCVNKKLQIDTDSLSCFWSPKKPKWFPGHPQRDKKQFQTGPKVWSRTDSTKRFPVDLPKGPFVMFWGARRCLFAKFWIRSVISSVDFSNSRG